MQWCQNNDLQNCVERIARAQGASSGLAELMDDWGFVARQPDASEADACELWREASRSSFRRHTSESCGASECPNSLWQLRRMREDCRVYAGRGEHRERLDCGPPTLRPLEAMASKPLRTLTLERILCGTCDRDAQISRRRVPDLDFLPLDGCSTVPGLAVPAPSRPSWLLPCSHLQ